MSGYIIISGLLLLGLGSGIFIHGLTVENVNKNGWFMFVLPVVGVVFIWAGLTALLKPWLS